MIFTRYKYKSLFCRHTGRKAVFLFIIITFLTIRLERPIFDITYSSVLEAESGELLAARISQEQQWVFPISEEIPEKFEKCITTFEDKRFYNHIGIDLLAIARAARDNMRFQRRTSGASTITMQTIRLSRKDKPRTFKEKFIEMILAFKLEIRYSKKEILNLYSSHAPFGGNVIGLEAASWRYYGRPAQSLSWAETATLAVLPNAPALIFPGRNQQQLLEKRNKLLRKLYLNGEIDQMLYQLSLQEPLPGKPHPLPELGAHLLETAIKNGKEGERIHSTINFSQQELTTKILNRYSAHYQEKGVQNAAALIIEIETGKVLTYIGNTENPDPNSGKDIDMIQTNRSSGSLLKPFLYALCINDYKILPSQLIPDYPIHFKGFSPSNMSHNFDGAINADRALARSLNIPFVFLLQEYGYQPFYIRLKQLGITLPFEPDHYGLAMILGAVETTMWDITTAYCSIARSLNNYNKYGNYSSKDYHPAHYKDSHTPPDYSSDRTKTTYLRAAPIYQTMETLTEVIRPEDEMKWERFLGQEKISWKTGTSFGARDGWAIGLDSKHLVAVWIGNADCSGISEFMASTFAGPILFEIFKTLPNPKWFDKPKLDLIEVEICKESGMLANRHCPHKEKREIPRFMDINPNQCTYHKLLHLDENEKYIVDSSFYPVSKMKSQAWFILPPVQEYFFSKKDSNYKTPPPLHPQLRTKKHQTMQFIYPNHTAKVYIPIEMSGEHGQVVFELAHIRPEAKVYWHINNTYSGMTSNKHQFGFSLDEGEYTITVVDETGEFLSKKIRVLENVHKENSE
ncbi:MAG: penicillin-binding protein 1C [Spirochaetales bacterium]|nr:penicillin-binding protein 1C [Spirochaetales bacterium]